MHQTWVRAGDLAVGPRTRTMWGVGEWVLSATQVTLQVAQLEKGRPERVRGGLTLHNVTSHALPALRLDPTDRFCY